MSRPVRTFITLLGLWLLGACEKPTAPPPPAAAKAAQATPLRYFGRPADGKLHVYFLDVDQGDATLIVSPTGRTVLVDAGPPSAGAHLANRLPELLTGKLDLVILTHPHVDHYGGLSAALGAVGAVRLLEPQLPGTPADYDALLGAIGTSGMEVFSPAPPANGEPLRLPLGGGAELTVLWPRAPTEKLLTGDNPQELNSIVLRLGYQDTSVLLPGDALEKTEQYLVARGAPLASTLLKVGAHGAATANSSAFLDAVRPRAALVSTGAGSPELAPSRNVLGRLEAMKARVFRTDRDGEVHAVSDGQRFTLTPQRHSAGSGPGESESFEGKLDPAVAERGDAGTPERDAGPAAPGKSEVAAASGAQPRGGPASTQGVDIDLDKTPAPAPKAPREERAPSPADGRTRYVASRKSDVFHLPDCPAVKRIKDENRLNFSTREQAASGNTRRPAKDCHP
ncbi:MBL fold metallo-hydrolase [Cystobacter fuscus]|uniref:ComEC/Rec2 family competence protein n=1 Tax=Cystobacter fuscus TaxID=43 RepID=UPI002B2D9686|nr:MBL fold metallo-hydrolase [Cystobacter fuscus]